MNGNMKKIVKRSFAASDARLTTGKADWQVGRLAGPVPAGADNDVWGTGSQWQVTGFGADKLL